MKSLVSGITKYVFVACAALAATLGMVESKAYAHGQICGVLFEDINYGGHAYILWGLNNSGNLGGWWNDRISSLYVGPGCSIKLFEHVNYGGLQVPYTGNQSFVGNLFNDQASSYQCTCQY